MGAMTTQANRSCNDCYFRQAGLCALPGNTPCPTFRAQARGSLGQSQQRPVTAPALPRLLAQHA
jgi:hypothetical protein